MKTKLIISGLAFLAITALANGQSNGADSRSQSNKRQGRTYVDANKNTICDNFENGLSNEPTGQRNYYCRFNGQGGQRQGQRLLMRNGLGPGQRTGNGTGMGRDRNRNFVDADKNGVCDYYEGSVTK